MKKSLKLGYTSAFIVTLFVLFYHQSRSFYCLSDKQCVTVWKRIGGTCYIIPGKYYGITKPGDNYIKTSNTNNATIYFISKSPNSIVVRSDRDYDIVNSKKNEIKILDFNLDSANYFKHILYNKDSKKFSDVNNGVNYMNIDIRESYATGKSGKKL